MKKNRKTNRRRIYLMLGPALIGGTVLAQQVFRYSQTEGTTARFDAQRSGWIRLDQFIAPDRMNGFALQWKTKIENTPKNGAALSSGIVTNGGLGITLAYLGGSDNRTIGIDMDNGHVFFNRSYGASPVVSGECPGASLAVPTRTTPLSPAMPGAPTAAGQSPTGPNAQLPYGSVIGAPDEGIPPVKPGSYFATPNSFFAANGAQPYDGTAGSAAAGAAYAATGPAGGRGFGGGGGRGGSGRGAGGGGFAPPEGLAGRGASGASRAGGGGGRGAFGAANAIYAISNDGTLHGLTLHDGLDGIQPIPFLPSGAQATDPIMIDGVLYTSTVNGCGGAPNAVWAITPAPVPAGGALPKPVSFATGGTASPHAPSFSADGEMFVSIGSGTGQYADSVISLDPTSLAVKNQFTQKGANFVSAPVIIGAGSRNIVAAQAADGRIFLLDGATLSAPLAVSPAVANIGGYKPAGLAAWDDASDQHWILSTTPTSAVAWKVAISGKSASFTQGWTIAGMQGPLAPLVDNGVVFALSTGNRTAPAVLYAVDGITGQKIWDSGKTIATSVPANSALWNSMGQVLVGSSDSTLYAFGMNMERHL